MLICNRCHSLCQDSLMRCPNCKSNKLQEAAEEDFVFLHRADLYTAQRLQEMFEKHGVAYRMEEFGKGQAGYFYDSEVMPTDKSVLVRYKDLAAAKELSAQLREVLSQEQEPGEEFEDMPRKKRIIVQALSVIAFMVIVMLTVFAADGAANWLKGLLGLG